jgi:hypothetical protein
MVDICVKKLDDNDLEYLKRDIEREIERRAAGPTKVVYQVTDWGNFRVFTDFRCAALCFFDIAESLLNDARSDDGKETFDLNVGTLLYGIRPIEITQNDFEAKISQKYFDDVCYEKRLSEVFVP